MSMIISGIIAVLIAFLLNYSLYDVSILNIILGVGVFAVYACASLTLLYLFTDGMKDGITRFKIMILHK